MKSINTLVQDIKGLFNDGFKPSDVGTFSTLLASRIASKASEKEQTPRLRISNIGRPCERQLWYEINHPEWAEGLRPEARIKFLYGDILEETLLYLAKEAGHDVRHEQMDVDLYGVKGKIDAVIDGIVVDCKSATSFSFDKFANHLVSDSDSFGYLGQLGGYVYATSMVEGFKGSNIGAFLVIDKTLGHICLDVHEFNNINWQDLVLHKQKVIENSSPPPRRFSPEPDGKSGNMKLGVNCSYCTFKYKCFTGIRTFMYYNGPRFLTKVVREPEVPEVKT